MKWKFDLTCFRGDVYTDVIFNGNMPWLSAHQQECPLNLVILRVNTTYEEIAIRFFSRVHATLYFTMSVGRSVGRSVRPCHLIFSPFFADFKANFSNCKANKHK